MILTCPQCATRYQADAAKFRPAGRNVRCAKCGHLWHQDPPPDEQDPLADLVAPEPEQPSEQPPEPAPPPPPPPPPPVLRSPQPRPEAYAPNPVIARDTATGDEPRAKSRWPMRIGVVLGWVALIAVVLALGWSALTFRQQIATVWPQSASVYSALGMKTKAAGLDIQNYATTRVSEAGQPVLVVTGTVANTGTHELPVPEIRAALTDEDRRELYQWKFMPGVTTLKPGQSVKFRSRLTNPPGGGSHVELRFAREGE
jgi:predicted Zn finger-like uncharacterized protein